MQSMGTLKRFFVVFFIVSDVFLVMVAVCNAMPPIDYSEGAANKLNKAANKVAQPIPKPGATNKDIARLVIDYWKHVYAAAGYDFEKSIVKIHKDLLKDPDYISKISYSSASSVVVSTKAITDDLVTMFTNLNLNPNKFLAKPTAAVVNGFIANNKKVAEAIRNDDYRDKLVESASSSTSMQDEQSKCFPYGINVDLKGSLKEVVFPGPPNYESLRSGDEPEPSYVLYVEKGVCVKGDQNDAVNSEGEYGVKLLQLMVTDYKKYKPLLGGEVVINGQLVHSQTGHHHTKVLVEVKGMAATASTDLSSEPKQEDGTTQAENETLVSVTETNSKVLEVVTCGGYTYLNVDNYGRNTWVSTSQTVVSVGSVIKYQDLPPMLDFNSKCLGRKLDSISFIPWIKVVN